MRRPAPGFLTHISDICRRPLHKVDVHGHRSRTIEQTWNLVGPLLPDIGVTRLADVTGLDQVGITVYQAIVPDSRDSISTYSGKGLDRDAARVSAAMEAYERYYGTRTPRVDLVCTLREAVEQGLPIFDPRDAAINVSDTFTEDTPVAWAWGYDIARDEPVLVATEQFSLTWDNPGEPVFNLFTTNGVASGNNITEAVIHGLYEVIERDAWTIADVLGQRLPDILDFGGAHDAGVGVLQPVDVDSLPQRLQDHVAHFRGVGILLQLFMIRADTRIPTCLAVTIEDSGAMSAAHMGLGTDADPEIAIGRAITEVAQSRCVDTAGGREDLSKAGDAVPEWARDTQRGTNSEPWRGSKNAVSLADCDGFATGDITSDLRETLARLRAVGLDRVVVVDMSGPGEPFAVCRVLVQGAEVWAADRGKIGQRLVDAWNAAVVKWESQAESLDPEEVSV